MILTPGTLTKFKELLSQASRFEFAAQGEEDKAVVRASLQTALDVADSAARSMASTVVMQRSSWLHSLGLHHKALPFEGVSLFPEQTDSKMHSLKDLRATLKSLGLYTLAISRKHYKLQLATLFFPAPMWSQKQLCSRGLGRKFLKLM